MIARARWPLAQCPDRRGIALEGVRAAVYTRDGRRIPREGEGELERARLREELARKDAEVERLQQLLNQRQGPNGS